MRGEETRSTIVCDETEDDECGGGVGWHGGGKIGGVVDALDGEGRGIVTTGATAGRGGGGDGGG